MTVWRLDTGNKRFGKTQSRWWKQLVQLRGDITRSEEMQIEALKESRGAKGMYGENIISREST